MWQEIVKKPFAKYVCNIFTKIMSYVVKRYSCMPAITFTLIKQKIQYFMFICGAFAMATVTSGMWVFLPTFTIYVI